MISVVIPTRLRPDSLALCLDRLAPGAQNLSADGYEVIVTDDGLPTGENLVGEKYPWAKWVPGPRRGPAANRNCGVGHALGDWIAFTDDDCLPSAGWLAAFRTAIRDGRSVYEGKTTCEAGLRSALDTAPVNLAGGYLWACNMMVRKVLFQELGGFDEAFPGPHMEDVDFRERLLTTGERFDFVPGAAVDHPARRADSGWRLGRGHESWVYRWYKSGRKEFCSPRLLSEIARTRLGHIRRFGPCADSLRALASMWVELGVLSASLPAWEWKYRPRSTARKSGLWRSLARAALPGQFRRAIQKRRLDRILAEYPARQVRHRYGEGELLLELSDPLAEGWYDCDWPTPPEIVLLRRGGLRAGGTVFDIGAHQGVVALMLAREVGPSGKVIAVEAHPHNARAAMRNRDLNGVPWIQVLNAGVGSIGGVLRFSRALNAQTSVASDHAGTFEVGAVTVDGLADRYGAPDVLYIDVEGMELEVLRGATRTLRARPDAFVEVHTGCGLESAGGSVGAVLASFPSEHYARFVHTEAAREPVALADAPAAWLRDRFFLTALSRRP